MANRIRAYRDSLGLTVRDLSERSGVAVGYLSALENESDGGTNPSKHVMDKIAGALGRTVPEVFYADGNGQHNIEPNSANCAAGLRPPANTGLDRV